MNEKIHFELGNIQNNLLEVIIMLNYRDSIERYVEMTEHYPQFHFIERRLIENIILRISSLIEDGSRANFNVLKPINRILSEKNFKDKHKEIRLLEVEIKNKISEPISQKFFYIRDKYLAHNDLNKRESVDGIIPNEIRKYAEELLRLINKVCETMVFPTASLMKYDGHSLDTIFEKLKM
jgi:hypothetical protein